MRTGGGARRAIAAAGMACFAAACSSAPATQGDAHPAQSHEGEGYLPPVSKSPPSSGAPHASTGHALKKHDASAARPAAATAHLAYYGGHVLANVKVVVVLWGAVDPTIASKIGGFYSAVTGSAYFDWLSEYDTTIQGVTGKPGSQQHIGRGSLAGVVPITPGHTSTSIVDADIQLELEAQIDAKKLPEPDPDTLYMIYFPHGTSIAMDDGSKSCVQFCAYHNTFVEPASDAGAKRELFYGVVPDFAPGSGCESGCGSNAVTFNNVTSASSHELIEAVTDSEVGIAPAQGFDAPLAWYDQDNGEIGDICNADQGAIAGYTVQKEWSNEAGKCVVSNSPPPPDKGPIFNAGFEQGDTSKWTASGAAGVASDEVHEGSYAAMLGTPFATSALDSAIAQTFTLPATGASKLSFWYSNHCNDKVRYDWATGTLKDEVTGATTEVLAHTCDFSPGWRNVVIDVGPSAGHAMTLTFTSHDDGFPGEASYTLIDQIELL